MRKLVVQRRSVLSFSFAVTLFVSGAVSSAAAIHETPTPLTVWHPIAYKTYAQHNEQMDNPKRPRPRVLVECGVEQPKLTISRVEVLMRAISWLRARIPYSMRSCSQWVEPKAHEKAYIANGNYRTDCSGMLSMAWGLGFSSRTSIVHAQALERVEGLRIIPTHELKPGDAFVATNTMLGRKRSGHTGIFVRWKTEVGGTAIVLEQTPGHTKLSEWPTRIHHKYDAVRADKVVDGPHGLVDMLVWTLLLTQSVSK